MSGYDGDGPPGIGGPPCAAAPLHIAEVMGSIHGHGAVPGSHLWRANLANHVVGCLEEALESACAMGEGSKLVDAIAYFKQGRRYEEYQCLLGREAPAEVSADVRGAVEGLLAIGQEAPPAVKGPRSARQPRRFKYHTVTASRLKAEAQRSTSKEPRVYFGRMQWQN